MNLLVVVVVVAAGPSSVAVDCPSYSGLACLVAFRPAQRVGANGNATKMPKKGRISIVELCAGRASRPIIDRFGNRNNGAPIKFRRQPTA